MNNKDPRQTVTRKQPIYLITFIIILVGLGIYLFITNQINNNTYDISRQELKEALEKHHVGELTAIVVGGENYEQYKVTGTFLEDYKSLYTRENFKIVLYQDEVLEFIKLGGADLKVDIKAKSSFDVLGFILNLIPIGFLIFVLFYLLRNANSSNNKAFDFAKSRAKLSRSKAVTFKDVAGCDEEKVELEEIIDFLKNPKKYIDMGARIPKGILLCGSPGTGKTLLAKAVAGEANVPFFSISGSDFVEMFVGVGAARVRDLFKVAKENSPCIIFVDEIDAVGRQRGTGLGGGHDEREQTLNQLLAEMDGFSTTSGIIMMAATNRPDVLDPALLRPGRFDRKIIISLPDLKARTQIIEVHIRNKKIDPKINLEELARRMPGFSGAEIENTLNEAALLAARENRTMILEPDCDEAIDRVMMGPAKKSIKYTEKEKKMIAYHEAGHAVIGILVEDANKVQKVTIIPRGMAGGYNLMTPLVETFTASKDRLLSEITGFLGGRVAEEVVYNTISTGAVNDIQHATTISRNMVTRYGMSELGPIMYENSTGDVFLGRDYFNEKNFSEQIAHEIDIEVRKIIDSCHKKATEVITSHRDLLDNIVKYLLEIETLNASDIKEIFETGKLAWYDTSHTK
ncbi:MAG: ATP-dependent zinc metalloprotease FtsH [Acholeplasmatales bacterium]|nr:ATP-dependent zinc metalloprotease FtsH [Acholeplasmatales bacterium]